MTQAPSRDPDWLTAQLTATGLLISELLASTESGLLPQKLTALLREFIGARIVLLVARHSGPDARDILCVSPDRYASLLSPWDLGRLCAEGMAYGLPRRLRDLPQDHPLRGPMGLMGVSSLLCFPLRVEGALTGNLLLLDLSEERRADEAEATLAPLLPVMAMALKNAFAHAIIERQAAALARQASELERRVAERTAELERSNRDLEQFAFIASHDLQEPLRMVASYTQLLAERYRDRLDDKARKYIDYAVDGATRMQRLIEDLLSWSRVGSRGKPLQPVDSLSVLQDALANLASPIAESGAVVTHGELPMVRADASQLLLLFQNLVSNAIKFRGKATPQVRVEACAEGMDTVFSVRDNGIGIEGRQLERIFEIFKRLHTRQEYPGTGIGLALCRRIVERHGGRIWCESAVGEGSAFFFTIPGR
jgi:signal transduction histidine kinase